MKEVKGKVAFITGGSSGIGLGIARAFADAGMKIVLANRTDKHLDEAMEVLKDYKDRVHSIRVDVTDRSGLKQAAAQTLDKFGKVHVLVNNAGVVIPKTVSQTSFEDWDWLMNVNLTSVFNGIRVFLPLIQSHGEGGHIVSTASTLGLFVWGSVEGVYPASKFAVTALMESLRAEMTGTDIGVSVFCPGWVRTNLGFSSRDAYPADLARSVYKEIPPERDAEGRKTLAASRIAIDPLECGQRVLEGMRRNDLYILSHPEWEGMMRQRHEALMAALPRDVPLAEERQKKADELTQNSIYAAELKKHF